MKLANILWGLLVMTGSIGGAWFVTRVDHSDGSTSKLHASDKGTDPKTDTAMKRDIARLEHAVAQNAVLIAQLQTALLSAPALAPSAPGVTGVAAPTEEQLTELAQQRTRDHIGVLEEKLQNETIDTTWGTRKAADIQAAFETIDASVAQVDCGSTLCRVVVEHDDAESQRNLPNVLGALEAFQENVVFDYDNDVKRPRTTLYVSR